MEAQEREELKILLKARFILKSRGQTATLKNNNLIRNNEIIPDEEIQSIIANFNDLQKLNNTPNTSQKDDESSTSNDQVSESATNDFDNANIRITRNNAYRHTRNKQTVFNHQP